MVGRMRVAESAANQEAKRQMSMPTLQRLRLDKRHTPMAATAPAGWTAYAAYLPRNR